MVLIEDDLLQKGRLFSFVFPPRAVSEQNSLYLSLRITIMLQMAIWRGLRGGLNVLVTSRFL